MSHFKLNYYPYNLELKHTFTIATHSRKSTPVMIVELEFDGVVGYGEASMPPYLGENQSSAADFLSQLDLTQFDDPFEIEAILSYVDLTAPGNNAAKAAVDIALHDLYGKILNKPLHKLLGYERDNTPFTSFTIGIDTPEIIKQKVKEAEEYEILKIKLGTDNDEELIKTIRDITDKPLTVDANQGWDDKYKALDFVDWLSQQNVLFVEQPMPKDMIEDNAWLTEHSPLPTFADEAVRRVEDIKNVFGVYSGINVKLMKSTGIREAHKMLIAGRSLGLSLMLGCMTETSCAISAAAQLSSLVDYADLDGALLIKNDLFDGIKILDGKVVLNDLPGIGATKISNSKGEK